MRNCPHCSREIQDEAIYCRHCHREVEPPLWITSMRRCPYCAEWTELEAEQCRHCDKLLYSGSPERAAPFVESSLDEFVTDLRAAPEPPAPPASPVESQINLLRRSYRESAELAPAPDEEPVSFGLRQRRDIRQDFGEAVEQQAEAPRRKLQLPAWLPRALLTVVILGGFGGGGYWLLRGPAAGLIAAAMATDVPPTPTIPAPTATLREAPTLPPATEVGGTPTPEGTGEPAAECLRWDQVGAEQVGAELCVYGVVKRWFAVDEVPFVAIFSEDPGTFALVDRTRTYSEVRPGVCIQGRGVVEIMRGTRPNIDVAGRLEFCDQPAPGG